MERPFASVTVTEKAARALRGGHPWVFAGEVLTKESPCPDGETKAVFSERVCRAFSALVDRALAEGEETLVILAHGGTQMAAMERYALPHADYYHWCAPNAGGYVLDAGDWAEQRVLHLLKTVQYTKEDAR